MSIVRISRFHDDVHGPCAAVDLPAEGGAIRVVGVGGFLSGLRSALSIASSIASNPIISSVLPPGTAAALNAVKSIAHAPNPQKAAGKFGGPGGARLQAAIKQDAKPIGPRPGAGRYYTLPEMPRRA
jgi:hypothetical protein